MVVPSVMVMCCVDVGMNVGNVVYMGDVVAVVDVVDVLGWMQ